jgi:hypothetical protein
MPPMAAEDPRLARLSGICLELPDASRTLSGRHAGFKVRGRTFAWYLDDHRGDGMVALNCKVEPGRNEALAAADPERYHLPAFLAHRGWIGYRLDVGEIDWDEVTGLVVESYMLVAPKTLAARVAGEH